MTLSDRIKIESYLNDNYSFNQIAKKVGKSKSAIGREIKSNLIIVDKYPPHRIKNRCINRLNCTMYGICEDKPNCTMP